MLVQSVQQDPTLGPMEDAAMSSSLIAAETELLVF